MRSLKTKVFTLFLSFVMAFSLIPALESNAATIVDQGTFGKGGKLTWVLTDDKVLTISGNGAMPNFVYQDASHGNYTNIPWYGHKYNIQKVVIKNGVTSVGNYAFCWHTSLKQIVWPNDGKLKTIGKYAFYETGLTKIVIPNGVTSVGDYAYCYCSNATSLTLSNTLVTIRPWAFAYCTAIKGGVLIPSSVQTIGTCGMRSLYKVTSITGGAGLVAIGQEAFAFDYALKTFSITSKKLKKIGYEAFCCCSKLKTIKLKKTTKLTKKGVYGSLWLSSVKTVRVKKSKVKKYKKIFKRSNSGRKVKVKKA